MSADIDAALADLYPVLRRMAARLSPRPAAREDLMQVAALAVWGLLAEDPETSRPVLLGAARHEMLHAAGDDQSGPLEVPRTHRRRYFAASALVRDEGLAPAEAAAAVGMTLETFEAAQAALRVDSLDALADRARQDEDATGSASPVLGGSGPNPRAEVAARRLLARLPVDVAEVLDLAHGVSDGRPRPDAEIADVLGCSRTTARRRRLAAADFARSLDLDLAALRELPPRDDPPGDVLAEAMAEAAARIAADRDAA